MDQPGARRRPVLKAALGGAAAAGAVGAVGVAARVRPRTDPEGGPALALAGQATDGIGELEVPLRPLLAATGEGVWETAGLTATPYTMLGLTWDTGEDLPALEVRTRSDDAWADWLPVPALADRPDADSGEDSARAGTELVWIGSADGVQVRATGARPRGLALVLLQPWAQPGDDDPDDDVLERRTGWVPRPHIRGRRHWGARESWRDGAPVYNRTIKQVHVHHTASSNRYGRRDVPALIRGMYRYHTKYLGWSDIGYNFLVDRFGRIWTGRAGGASRPVRGAHTLGFNATSTGIAVIGNFDLTRPSDDVLEAVARVAAWKLRSYRRDPLDSVMVWSKGSDRFSSGRRVRLPTIDGHRDTNQTACPGGHLYRHLPEIRHRTAALIRYYSRVHVRTAPELHGTPALGSTLTVDPGSYLPADAALTYVWLRDGRRIPRADGPSYAVRPADVGTRISVRVTARRRGLKPVTRRRWSSGVTTGPSSLTLDTSTADRALRVRVRVDSPAGVRPTAHGKVVVKVGRRRAVVHLADGRGVATFGDRRPLSRGAHRVRARYLGDRVHAPDRATTRIWVSR